MSSAYHRHSTDLVGSCNFVRGVDGRRSMTLFIVWMHTKQSVTPKTMQAVGLCDRLPTFSTDWLAGRKVFVFFLPVSPSVRLSVCLSAQVSASSIHLDCTHVLYRFDRCCINCTMFVPRLSVCLYVCLYVNLRVMCGKRQPLQVSLCGASRQSTTGGRAIHVMCIFVRLGGLWDASVCTCAA